MYEINVAVGYVKAMGVLMIIAGILGIFIVLIQHRSLPLLAGAVVAILAGSLLLRTTPRGNDI